MSGNKLIERLRETLARSDTVILVGSGVSLWSGLPNWPTLISELADFVDQRGRSAAPVREEIANGDLLLAASYAIHQLGVRDFGAFIRQALKHPNAQPAEIHHLVANSARLASRQRITTDFWKRPLPAVAGTPRNQHISSQPPKSRYALGPAEAALELAP
jgi:hypothetical protein